MLVHTLQSGYYQRLRKKAVLYLVWHFFNICFLLPFSFGCHNFLFLLDGCVDYMVAVLEVKDLEISKVDVQYAISIPCWSFWFLHCNLYPLAIGSYRAVKYSFDGAALFVQFMSRFSWF
ncbi:hypothetical protein H5410_036088, partial [Solanum commersonii]